MQAVQCLVNGFLWGAANFYGASAPRILASLLRLSHLNAYSGLAWRRRVRALCFSQWPPQFSLLIHGGIRAFVWL